MLCLILTAGLALALRRRRYRAALRGSARRDDVFATRHPPPVTFEVSSGPEGFDLPATIERVGQTVFLHLRLESTWRGRLFDPSIALAFRARGESVPSSGEAWHFQCFERGARGLRYLNLSPLFARLSGRTPGVIPLAGWGAGGGQIVLRGRFLRWSGAASLLVFPAGAPDLDEASRRGPCLVLAPHPDDAELAAFGMYARQPARSWVVTLTAGEQGSAALSPLIPPEAQARWLGETRVNDSLSIPGQAGVPAGQCGNLVYPDGRLAEMWRAPEQPFRLACEADLPRATLRARNPPAWFGGRGHTADSREPPGPAECTWNGLVAELRRLLESVKPSVVLCPHPLIDTHPDHVFTAVALDAALRGAAGVARPAIWLYAVHVRDFPMHPIGPPEALVSLPPGTSLGALPEDSNAEWLAEALVSLPLAPDLRRAKYLAVEAAHDLRRQDPLTRRTLGQLLGLFRRELSCYLAGLGPTPTSFLRRAPRPNEIYFVVSPEALAGLVARALGRPGPDA